jgi:hypothetical protein
MGVVMENISHIFTVLCGTPPPKAEEVIIRNKHYCGHIGMDFVIHPFSVFSGETMLQAADRARFTYAAENPSTIYMDWDCLIIDFPKVNPEYPLFPFMNENGLFDYFCFYTGKDAVRFKKYLEFHNAKYRNDSNYWMSLQDFFKGRIQNYPPATYRHYSLRGWDQCNP